jgi:SPX domain protein involved in polyphosphate accumulation
MAAKGTFFLRTAPNSTFLTIYHHHVIHRWKMNYFSYDGLRSIYKEVKKGAEGTNLSVLELAFDMEIKRVTDFIDSCLSDFERAMDGLQDEVDDLVAAKEESQVSGGHRNKKVKDEEDDDELFGEEKIIDGMIREVYRECNDMSTFLELNLFAVAKMAKKFRKVCSSSQNPVRVEDGVDIWTSYQSYTSYCELVERRDCIKDVLKRIEEVYCSAFRTTYPELAEGELHFDKDKHQQMKKNRIGLGFKLGIIFTLVSIIAASAALLLLRCFCLRCFC